MYQTHTQKQEDALKKNKYDNKEAIVGLLEKGAGVMPK